MVFDDAHRRKVPPGNGTPQEIAILNTLEEAQPAGPTAVGKVLTELAPRLRHRGITVVFSDFIDEPREIMEGVKRLVYGGHEPILFQVLDPLELTFDLDSPGPDPVFKPVPRFGSQPAGIGEHHDRQWPLQKIEDPAVTDFSERF